MAETMRCEVSLNAQKIIVEYRDKLKITKHLIFPIWYCQRETIYIFFTILINSKLISELV